MEAPIRCGEAECSNGRAHWPAVEVLTENCSGALTMTSLLVTSRKAPTGLVAVKLNRDLPREQEMGRRQFSMWDNNA